MSETTFQTTRPSARSTPMAAVLGATAAAVVIWGRGERGRRMS